MTGIQVVAPALLLAAVAGAAAVLVSCRLQAAEPQETKKGEPLQALLKAQVELAHKGYAAASKMYTQVRRVGGTVVQVATTDQVYAWSQRWLTAQGAVSSDSKARLAAAAAHLERMKELERSAKALEEGGLVTPLESLAAEFYRREAEIGLATAKAGRPGKD